MINLQQIQGVIQHYLQAPRSILHVLGFDFDKTLYEQHSDHSICYLNDQGIPMVIFEKAGVIQHLPLAELSVAKGQDLDQLRELCLRQLATGNAVAVLSHAHNALSEKQGLLLIRAQKQLGIAVDNSQLLMSEKLVQAYLQHVLFPNTFDLRQFAGHHAIELPNSLQSTESICNEFIVIAHRNSKQNDTGARANSKTEHVQELLKKLQENGTLNDNPQIFLRLLDDSSDNGKFLNHPLEDNNVAVSVDAATLQITSYDKAAGKVHLSAVKIKRFGKSDDDGISLQDAVAKELNNITELTTAMEQVRQTLVLLKRQLESSERNKLEAIKVPMEALLSLLNKYADSAVIQAICTDVMMQYTKFETKSKGFFSGLTSGKSSDLELSIRQAINNIGMQLNVVELFNILQDSLSTYNQEPNEENLWQLSATVKNVHAIYSANKLSHPDLSKVIHAVETIIDKDMGQLPLPPLPPAEILDSTSISQYPHPEHVNSFAGVLVAENEHTSTSSHTLPPPLPPKRTKAALPGDDGEIHLKDNLSARLGFEKDGVFTQQTRRHQGGPSIRPTQTTSTDSDGSGQGPSQPHSTSFGRGSHE